jgi:YD repeat-containing protein
MATITAGQSASFTLDAFGYITVSSVIAGTLTGVSQAQTLKSNVFVSKLARTVYGPYGVPMEFVIASTDGPLTYTTTAGYGGGTGDVSSDTIWDAAGDTIYGTGANTAARLPIGTAGQVLTVNAGATAPEWADVTTSNSGGGGSDRTAVTTEADPVNGGKRVLTETVDGIPWTFSYDAQGRLIEREWAAGGLTATIAYDADGFGTASGNIFRDGGAIETTASQMAALKTALTALALTNNTSPNFYVRDSGTGLTLEWNPTNNCFRFPGGYGTIRFLTNSTGVASPAAAEVTLATITLPGWLRAPGAIYRFSSHFDVPNAAIVKTVRHKANGTAFMSFATGATTIETQVDNALWELAAGTLRHFATGATIGETGTYQGASQPTISATADADVTFTQTVQYASDPGAITTSSTLCTLDLKIS